MTQTQSTTPIMLWQVQQGCIFAFCRPRLFLVAAEKLQRNKEASQLKLFAMEI